MLVLEVYISCFKEIRQHFSQINHSFINTSSYGDDTGHSQSTVSD